MKRWVIAVSVFLAGASAAWATEPTMLTSLRQIHALTNEQANNGYPVVFEAIVTYYRGFERTLFVQEDSTAIFVSYPDDAKLVPGDRISVTGTTKGDFRPMVIAKSISLLGHTALPKPIPATYPELIQAKYDCLLVTVQGVVQSADFNLSPDLKPRSIRMHLLTTDGPIVVEIDSTDPHATTDLLDAEVDVTGAVSGVLDGKAQMAGVLLHVSSLADVKVLHRASESLAALPVTPMDEVLASYRVNDLTQRVKVRGTLTYYEPGSMVVLQQGSRSLRVATLHHLNDLALGNLVEATGFPGTHNGFLNLTQGSVVDTQTVAYVAPALATWAQLASSRHIFDLVSIDGQVIAQVRLPSEDEYILLADGQIFTAYYRHLAGNIPMKLVPIGSRIRVTGICVLEDANPYRGQVPFSILLRSFDDIAIVAPPSMLNMRNLGLLAGLLFLIVILAGVRSWTLERRVRMQTSAMAARVEKDAALERRRSRILEDINGSEPLTGILEQICGLVSSTLGGAPCWCQIADGATLGNAKQDAHSIHPASAEIPSRSGSPLGKIFAGTGPVACSKADVAQALSIGARVATLAIETRRLYTDLVRRSEYDLLTDIHNRFSLDKQLDARIAEAHRVAGVFGLIYIDLDKFKEINDRYGHHIGDLYLQEVAQRMKRQLRGGDILARLGGDEFAALLTMVRNRADVEEVVHRIERSFEDPFVVEAYILRGAASIGFSLYPDDGASKSSLLSAADSAMYVVKNQRHKAGPAGTSEPQTDSVSTSLR